MDAVCAVHGDRPGPRTCPRCGSHACLECLDGGDDTLCRACSERLEQRGYVPHVEWLSVVLMVHGVLVAGIGLMLLVIFGGVASVFDASTLAPSSGAPVDPEVMNTVRATMAGLGGLLGVVIGVSGGLQFLAGWKLRLFKSAALVWVGLLVPVLGTLFSCYCVPTSILLAAWGGFVLLDPSVKERFRVAAGTT